MLQIDSSRGVESQHQRVLRTLGGTRCLGLMDCALGEDRRLGCLLGFLVVIFQRTQQRKVRVAAEHPRVGWIVDRTKARDELVIALVQTAARQQHAAFLRAVELGAQRVPHRVAQPDQSTHAPRAFLRELGHRRQHAARADGNAAIVERGEGVFLDVLRCQDRLFFHSGGSTGWAACNSFRAQHAFGQKSDGRAQRRCQVTAVRRERRLVRAVHRASVAHGAQHHVRVGREVFVDLESHPIRVAVLG